MSYFFFAGVLGRPVELVTNCIEIFSGQDWKLQKYRIYFNPNVETKVKKEMLVKHISFLGECVLEGNIMYSFIKYEHKVSLFQYLIQKYIFILPIFCRKLTYTNTVAIVVCW